MLIRGLLTSIAIVLLSPAGPAYSLDPIAGPSSLSKPIPVRPDACNPGTGRAVPERCLAVITTDLQAGRILSDHGASIGEPYDAQGNPLDRHGDIVAVPESPATAAAPSGLAREVFAAQPRTPSIAAADR
jgi:hypothetical protein